MIMMVFSPYFFIFLSTRFIPDFDPAFTDPSAVFFVFFLLFNFNFYGILLLIYVILFFFLFIDLVCRPW